MTKYKIVIGIDAEKDFEEIKNYLLSVSYSQSVVTAFAEKIDKNISILKDFPRIGVVSNNIFYSGKKYRKLIVDDYIVYYYVCNKQKEVRIRRVVSGCLDNVDVL